MGTKQIFLVIASVSEAIHRSRNKCAMTYFGTFHQPHVIAENLRFVRDLISWIASLLSDYSGCRLMELSQANVHEVR